MEEKLSWGRRWCYIVCIAVCLLILAPLLIIGIYSRPSADDFDYAYLTHQAVENNKGVFGILWAAWKTNLSFYNDWQGLYTSAFILALQPAIFGEKLYALTPFIVMGCAYLFLLLSVHLLNKAYIKKSFFYSATLALVLLTLLMLWLPSATEGLYWFNGAMNYMPWAFTNLFNVCLFLYIKDKPPTKKVITAVVLSTLLSFLTSGGNHVTAFGNILQLLFLSVFFVRKKNWYLLFPVAFACIGFLIMYLAPGTTVRAEAIGEEATFLETVGAVLLKMQSSVSGWVNMQWLISLAVVTPVCVEIARKNKGKFSWRLSFCVLMLSVIILCGMFAVPYYAMKHFGAPRIANVIWITFTFLCWLNYALLIGVLIQKNVLSLEGVCLRKANVLPYAVTALVCVGLLCSTVTLGSTQSNTLLTATELMDGTAKAYCQEMDARFALYHDETLSEVGVKPVETESILFLGDFGYDPNVWPNTSIGRYYGKPIYLVP